MSEPHALVEQVLDSETLVEMKRAFHGVFRSADAYQNPLQPDVRGRALLFPSWDNLVERDWDALVAAAAQICERDAYFSSIEGYGTRTTFERHLHFRVRLVEDSHREVMMRLRIHKYIGVVGSVLYSRSGTWGALTSPDIHAVVGGPPSFVSALGTRYDLDGAILEFLRWWKRNETAWKVDVTWAGELTRHVYGDERALELLREVQFPGYEHR